MSRQKKIALILAGSVAAILLFCFAILPAIVRDKAIKAIEDETGRTTHIAKVAINPFTLTVTVTGFALDSKEGGPFISVGTLRASLGLASIFRRAPIISELTVDTPAITFARLAANRYSFNDIIERQAAKPKKEPKGDTRFSINNITIRNGSIDFDDRAVDGGRKHTVRALQVGVPFISTIPYQVELFTSPQLSAIVDGAAFNFNGKVKPFSSSRETSVNINLKQLDLPKLAAYSPVAPPANLVSGKLTIDTEVNYRVSNNSNPQLAVKGVIRLDNIGVNLKNGQPLLKLPVFQVKASNLEIFAQRFLFESITVDGLELFASRSAKGEWMYSHLLTPPAKAVKKPGTAPEKGKKPESAKKAAQPLVTIAALTFTNGIVHVNDALPKGGYRGEISQIDVAAKNFSTAPGTSADYTLSMMLDNEATFSADGGFSLSPLAVTSSAELSGLKLQRGWPYLSQFLTAPIKGNLDLSAEADYTKEHGLNVKQGSLTLQGFSTRYGAKEGFDLALLNLGDVVYSQEKNRLEMAEITVSRGAVSLSREEDGSISLLSLLKKTHRRVNTPKSCSESFITGKTASRQRAFVPNQKGRGEQVQCRLYRQDTPRQSSFHPDQYPGETGKPERAEVHPFSAPLRRHIQQGNSAQGKRPNHRKPLPLQGKRQYRSPAAARFRGLFPLQYQRVYRRWHCRHQHERGHSTQGWQADRDIQGERRHPVISCP